MPSIQEAAADTAAASQIQQALPPDGERERSARRALMVGIVANAGLAGYYVFLGCMIAVIAARAPGAAGFFAGMLFVMGAMLGGCAFALKRWRSAIAGWIAFSLNALSTLLTAASLAASLVAAIADLPIAIILLDLIAVLLLAIGTVCSFVGVRGARALRLYAPATPSGAAEATLPGDRIDFANLYTSFEGRINRRGFWIGYSLIFILWIAFPLLSAAVKPGRELALLMSAIQLVSWYPIAALLVKRLHDLNWSGYIAGFLLVPGLPLWLSQAAGWHDPFAFWWVGNALGYLYLAWMSVLMIGFAIISFGPGTAGPNAYGPDPLGPRS